MTARPTDRHALAVALALSVVFTLSACGKQDAGTASTAPAAPPAAASPEAVAPPPTSVPPPQPVQAADVAQRTWTPEALEDLLAPVALYPDPVLSQVLIASTNPQEVLDAGNWLIANPNLSGKALDTAAAQAGFTPPIRALVQFPQTVDLMCVEMDWTAEMGEAFVADQAGVLDAVQRLRRQAKDVGNLQSSDAMKVETQVQEGKEVIVLSPPKPEVVYVPTYDPVQAYAPLPQQTAAATTTPATTTTTTTESKGYSGTQMFMTGALAFGAGILVNEVFDDDDNNYKNYGYYYPNYGYGGMPYYPPYPYRPAYGGGWYPNSNYNRPGNWNGGYQNNGNIIINTGGNDYWDRYDSGRPGLSGGSGNRYDRPQTRPIKSPITQARPNRPELAQLNTREARRMPDSVRPPSPTATAANWKGQSSYKGRDQRPAAQQNTTRERISTAQPGYSKPAPGSASKMPPKVQGSYAGAKDRQAARPAEIPARPAAKPASKPVAKPAAVKKPPVGGDRGYGTRDVQRPAATPAKAKPATRDVQPQKAKPTAVSGAGRDASRDRAASQRGKQSLPQGARSKGAGKAGKAGKAR
jgi:hypothetical protein